MKWFRDLFREEPEMVPHPRVGFTIMDEVRISDEIWEELLKQEAEEQAKRPTWKLELYEGENGWWHWEAYTLHERDSWGILNEADAEYWEFEHESKASTKALAEKHGRNYVKERKRLAALSEDRTVIEIVEDE